MTELLICRGTNVMYLARVRRRGCRNYEMVGEPVPNSDMAAQLLMIKFCCDESYKRGDVIMTADYYEPRIIMEVTRP